MKRRALPIVSVVCLVLAGAMATGYVVYLPVAMTYHGHGTGRYAYWFFGISLRHGMVGAQFDGTATSDDDLNRLRWGRPRWDFAGADIRKTLFSIYTKNYYGADGSHHLSIDVPLWLTILPMLAPPLLYWRRRRRQRLNAPGFPVTATKGEAVG